MAKTLLSAPNVYWIFNWIKSINRDAEEGKITEIKFGNKPYCGKWNKSCWLNIEEDEVYIFHKSKLYWGVVIEITNKNKEHIYKALKQLIYRLPIIVEGRDVTYTYKKYASKLKFIERKLRYDPDRKTSKGN